MFLVLLLVLALLLLLLQPNLLPLILDNLRLGLAFEQQALDQEPYERKLLALYYIRAYALLSLFKQYCMAPLAHTLMESDVKVNNKGRPFIRRRSNQCMVRSLRLGWRAGLMSWYEAC